LKMMILGFLSIGDMFGGGDGRILLSNR